MKALNYNQGKLKTPRISIYYRWIRRRFKHLFKKKLLKMKPRHIKSKKRVVLGKLDFNFKIYYHKCQGIEFK